MTSTYLLEIKASVKKTVADNPGITLAEIVDKTNIMHRDIFPALSRLMKDGSVTRKAEANNTSWSYYVEA